MMLELVLLEAYGLSYSPLSLGALDLTLKI